MKRLTLLVLVIFCIIISACGTPSDDVSQFESTAANDSMAVSAGSAADGTDFSVGLQMKKTTSGEGYIVTGIGTCEDADIVIPETVDGIPVIEIGKGAFKDNKKIKSVCCGDRVEKLGDNAFSGCKNLKKTVIPESVTYIGAECFERCGLSEISLPDGITFMGDAAFQLCASLSSVKMPLNLTDIPDEAFSGCGNLTAVELSPLTAAIGYQSFGATGITALHIPKSVQSISTDAFSGAKIAFFDVDEENRSFCSIDGALFNCDRTELLFYPRGKTGEYTVPDGVQQIAEHAFYNCNEVTLPASLRSISSGAFTTEGGSLVINIKNGLKYIAEYAFLTNGSGVKVKINFDGTKVEWDAIEKSEEWYKPYYGLGNQTVIVNCSDGALDFVWRESY